MVKYHQQYAWWNTLQRTCQIRDYDLIDITDCLRCLKSEALLCLCLKCLKWGTIEAPERGLTRFLDILCIMHLMYAYIHESSEIKFFQFGLVFLCFIPKKCSFYMYFCCPSLASTPVRGPIEDSGRIWLSMVKSAVSMVKCH